MTGCVICGNPLPPRRTKYCSEACAREGERRLAREVTSQRPRPKPYHTIICPDCGREVCVPIKSKRCPDCQAEADRRHNAECKQRKRANKVRAIGSIDLCERCGQPYTVEGGMQRYCKDCAAIAIAENGRAASRKWNAEHYSDPDQRRKKNEGKRRPRAEAVTCPVCGITFTPETSRGVYCSRKCARIAHDAYLKRYEAGHREQINARHAMRAQEKLDAMTPEERQARRDAINKRARENYAKRKEKKRGSDHN